jgi:hypothetical protein
MTHQNTDARVIELHEKRQAIKRMLTRSVPRGRKQRAALIARAATIPLIDRKAIAEEMKRRHG